MKQSLCRAIGFAFTISVPTLCTASQEESPLSRLPVKEVAVFKDGHAFVRHEGAASVDIDGKARLDHLPAPIMGAFWVSSMDVDRPLVSVVAGRRRVEVKRIARDLREVIEGNVGRKALVTEVDGASYLATIEDVPFARLPEDQGETPPIPNTVPGAEIVALRGESGVRAVPLQRIRDLTFPEGFATSFLRFEDRNLLTLNFAPSPSGSSDVPISMGYVQRGLRWIPSYRLEVMEGGHAHARMQATLLNELTDLEDATVHLVIGVPTFRFKDTLDPMSMQQTMAQLSSYFGDGNRRGMSNFLGNAIMSQQARRSEYAEPTAEGPGAGSDLGPESPQGGGVEDLYVWSVEHASLRKGECMVLPITEFDVTCEDRFVLEVPVSPLPEIRQQFNSQQDADLAQLLAAPKVMHQLHLTNSTAHPFTTAPMLMIRDGRPLGQGMVTYTPPLGTVDVEVTAAVGISVAKTESEVERIPDAQVWKNNHLERVNLEGTLTLTNFREAPVVVSVIRHMLGHVDEVDHEGTMRMENILELSPGVGGGAGPNWWGSYQWPSWWWSVNGVGRTDWNVRLEKGQSVKLTYRWHYFHAP